MPPTTTPSVPFCILQSNANRVAASHHCQSSVGGVDAASLTSTGWHLIPLQGCHTKNFGVSILRSREDLLSSNTLLAVMMSDDEDHDQK
jgi:hypothetical protein